MYNILLILSSVFSILLFLIKPLIKNKLSKKYLEWRNVALTNDVVNKKFEKSFYLFIYHLSALFLCILTFKNEKWIKNQANYVIPFKTIPMKFICLYLYEISFYFVEIIGDLYERRSKCIILDKTKINEKSSKEFNKDESDKTKMNIVSANTTLRYTNNATIANININKMDIQSININEKISNKLNLNEKELNSNLKDNKYSNYSNSNDNSKTFYDFMALLLLILSFNKQMIKLGVLILFVHILSLPIFELSKMEYYMKNYLFSNILFFIFMNIFIIFRLLIFPRFFVVQSIKVLLYSKNNNLMNILKISVLLSLQVMHFIWCKYIFDIFRRIMNCEEEIENNEK